MRSSAKDNKTGDAENALEELRVARRKRKAVEADLSVTVLGMFFFGVVSCPVWWWSTTNFGPSMSPHGWIIAQVLLAMHFGAGNV